MRGIICLGILLFLPLSHVFATVVINEFSPHSNPEWVELYNASDSADYIKNYFIDDDTSFDSDSGSSAKKSLLELNTSSVQFPFIDNFSNFFNTDADFVVLFDEMGIIVQQFQYTEDPGDGVTIGRNPDETGSFMKLTFATKGSANAGAIIPSATTVPTATRTPTPLNTSTPTKTPTSSPTNKPIATQVPIVAATLTKTPTQRMTPTLESTPQEENTPAILGVDTTEVSTATTKTTKPVIISLLFVSTGFALLAGVLVWQKKDIWKKMVSQK